MEINEKFCKAAENGELDLVIKLWWNNIVSETTMNFSILIASENGHIKVVKFLAGKGADIHVKKDGEKVERLFDDYKYGRLNNNYPIKYAAKNGHFEVVKFLVEKGADVNAGFEGVCTSKHDNVDLATFLVEKGAIIHDNAFHSVCRLCHYELIKFFWEKGVDIQQQRHYALCYATDQMRLDIIKFLWEKGDDIFAHDNFVIRIASERGNLPVVKFLWEKGADIHVWNNYAISWASANGHVDVVKFLFEKGKAKFSVADLQSFLFRACEKGHLKIVHFFYENGVDIRAKAIFWAAAYGTIEIAEFLIQKGADVCANDNEPIQIASQNQRFTMVCFLWNKGADFSFISLADRTKIYFLKSLKKKYAAEKIARWWIPICYDPLRECGKRMMQRNWEKLEKMYTTITF